MFLPTPKLLLLLALPLIVLLVFHGSGAVVLVVAYDIALLAVAGLTVLLSTGPQDLTFKRRLPQHLSLGSANSIAWEVRNASGMPVRFEATEDLPDTIRRDAERMSATILPRATAELHYSVTPLRRGRYEFGDIYIRWRLQLGLLVRQMRIKVRDEVKVYPNVQNLARYELAAMRHRTTEVGLAPVKRRGRGRVFESLRDYVPGDDPADAAWKATARHGRLMTRNFETERSQNILIVLDCGRLMLPQVDQLSRLDHAINASVLLSYVAMKQGDYIGLVAFSDKVETYVPPIKGRAALARMNEALYRLEAVPREPDYDRVCKFLALRHRKRSLIVILTDVIDKDASSMLLAYTARFARYHLPLCVTMRNLQVEGMAAREPSTVAECYSKAVALKMLARRADALARMRQSGVDVLDVDPRQLTPQLLNRYLLLKMRNRL
jgi:uncharacterized protein (DUF58 family)